MGDGTAAFVAQLWGGCTARGLYRTTVSLAQQVYHAVAVDVGVKHTCYVTGATQHTFAKPPSSLKVKALSHIPLP